MSIPDHSQRIAELLRQGRKIEAIKLFSETTGVDLSTAKREIDRIDEAMTAEDIGLAMTTPSDISYSPADPLPDDVVSLMQEGRKIEAIKLLRDRTGLGLKEAKDRVESVYGKGKGGCAGSIALIIGGGAMLAVLMV